GCLIEAVTSSSPPAGAPTFAVLVWIRPEVQLLPLPMAVMSRSPLPSRCTFEVEFVIVSISPVPKVEPAPVSYIQLDVLTPVPEVPAKSSLNTVVQPEGGAGTAAEAAVVLSTVRPSPARADAASIASAAPIERRRPSGAEVYMALNKGALLALLQVGWTRARTGAGTPVIRKAGAGGAWCGWGLVRVESALRPVVCTSAVRVRQSPGNVFGPSENVSEGARGGPPAVPGRPSAAPFDPVRPHPDGSARGRRRVSGSGPAD